MNNRRRSDEFISAFGTELMNVDWKEVIKETDTNKAFSLFLDIYYSFIG